jgi:hypothetical protein
MERGRNTGDRSGHSKGGGGTQIKMRGRRGKEEGAKEVKRKGRREDGMSLTDVAQSELQQRERPGGWADL